MSITKEYYYNVTMDGDFKTYNTIVCLTKAEHKAVQKFLSQLDPKNFCGYCDIGEIAYENEQDCREMKNGY